MYFELRTEVLGLETKGTGNVHWNTLEDNTDTKREREKGQYQRESEAGGISAGSGEAGGPALDGQDPTGQTGREPGDITPQLHPTVAVVIDTKAWKRSEGKEMERE